MSAAVRRSIRRPLLGGLAVLAGLAVLPAAAPASAATRAQRIDTAIRATMKQYGLHAVIVQASTGRRTVIRKAYGTSLPGVPASVHMHFRNGNVAAAYVSTLLLRLVDQGKVRLSDPLSKFRPDLRNLPGPGDGDRVTLGMLAGMTAGYHDYEQDPRLADTIYAHPFEPMTTAAKLALAFSKPIQFAPGSNFSYAHTDYVLLGLALEKITHQPLQTAIRRQVLRPLGLHHTHASTTAHVPSPVLHTFSSERREYLGIPAGQPFLEESTSWNPAWTFPRGAVETTTIGDMTRSMVAIGTGRLLSRSSFRRQIAPRNGFGRPLEGCEGCRTLVPGLAYGMGVFRRGAWIAVEPLFAGLGSVASYLPAGHVALSIVAAMGQDSFTPDGSGANYARLLFRQIAPILAPEHVPPAPPTS